MNYFEWKQEAIGLRFSDDCLWATQMAQLEELLKERRVCLVACNGLSTEKLLKYQRVVGAKLKEFVDQGNTVIMTGFTNCNDSEAFLGGFEDYYCWKNIGQSEKKLRKLRFSNHPHAQRFAALFDKSLDAIGSCTFFYHATTPTKLCENSVVLAFAVSKEHVFIAERKIGKGLVLSVNFLSVSKEGKLRGKRQIDS